jgi:hypothetical protein
MDDDSDNLGAALMRLRNLTGDPARLAEVVIGYRAALEERTRERDPLGWAGIQGNLGNACTAW